MKKIILAVAVLVLTACAQDGDRGSTGPTGAPGQDGTDGQDGSDGFVVVGEYELVESCFPVNAGLFAKKVGNKIRLSTNDLCDDKLAELSGNSPTSLVGSLLFMQDSVEKNVLVVVQLK